MPQTIPDDNAQRMLEVGQTVGRYRVEEVLGEGGMAVVYRVRHESLQSEHALKVLTTQKKSVRQRLLAEGRVQGQLNHPNALSVTDVIEVGDAPGLVMELITGGSMFDWLYRDRPDREERLEVFRQVVDCLAEAHRRGWVHRDLKPENVMMDRVGRRVIPKVADFGLVKALTEPLNQVKTRQGIAMGTPGFMAIEQFVDASNVGPTADVFSLGCLLIWLITEQIPFPGEGPSEVFENVAADNRVRLRPADPMAQISDICLAQQPAHRYQTADELRRALDEVLGSRPDGFDSSTERRTAIRPPSPSSRAKTIQTQHSIAPTTEPRGRGRLLGGMVSLAFLTVFATIGVLFVVALGALLWTASVRNDRICNIQGTSGRMGTIAVTKAPEVGYWVLPRRMSLKKRLGTRQIRCELPAGTRIKVDAVEARTVIVTYDANAQLPQPYRTMRLLLGNPAN